MADYTGPAVVLVEGAEQDVPVTAALVSVGAEGSPVSRWHGRLEPRKPGALWSAHMAGRAQLMVRGRPGDFRITAYSDSGPSEVVGLGHPPF